MSVSKPHQELFSRIEDAHHHLTKTDCDGCNAAAALIYDLEEQYEIDKHAWKCLDEEREAEIARLKEQLEALDETLRDILDVTEKWTRQMSDAERLTAIAWRAKEALRPTSTPAKQPYVYSGDVNDPGPYVSNQESKP